MGEIVIEIIGQFVLELFFAVGGLLLDLLLIITNVRISWGHCYNKHPLASILTIILCILFPVHICNWGFTNGLFVYLGILVCTFIVVYLSNVNVKKTLNKSNILDDEFLS
ncbi:hypothetical protein [Aureispira sp. CCB-QB1]|uniref:hypothetical protein n=1 Tax=Aureispira sp. CCB-QB1 TaxID=1313421 RepID=UPI00069607A9|nr:hypothetical protein [Aureispira sp. CCB-QB1]